MGNFNANVNNYRSNSQIVGQPIGPDGFTSIFEQSITADEAALFGSASSGVTFSDLSLTALIAPGGLVITQGGTAATTNYSYIVVDIGNIGVAPTASTQTTTGPVTLTLVNYNTISFFGITGHTYQIYRSTSSGTPGTTGLLATVTGAGIGIVFNDTGTITPTGSAPTVNTSGAIYVPGPIFGGGLVLSGAAPSANTTASGGATLTVANILTNVLLRSGGGAQTDTTPTAAQIIAGIRGAVAGMGWVWTVRNALTGLQTLGQAATGITWAAGNTNTVATLSSHTFYVQITNAAQGSEAITIYSLIGSVAY